MRHAVLSPDDPVINSRLHRRPRTFEEKSFSAKHKQAETKLDCLNSCFMNLHVVVEKNFPNNKMPPRIVRRQSAPPCARICSGKTGDLVEIYVNDIDKLNEDCQTLEKEEATFRSMNETTFNHSSNIEQSMCLQRDTFSTMTKYKQADRSSDAHSWNPLSERVLQWLDLSGRAQDYELMESEESSKKVEERGSTVRRRRQISQTRENSIFAGRERIVVQNYKLQKNCKSECITKITETKLARKRLFKIKDAMGNKIRKEESTQLKDLVSDVEEDVLKNEDESRNDLSSAWSPPGRLQLHIVMPSFNFVEKRASSLESLICD
ncbi:uncharacterized protein LOC126853509 [Cataglyphis hispanica]|uniref:uncharacterized protein LOC126853509 n=1 Tax=Cataglyphis hispanica TaxID=1086592 RepID=UPI0021809973|nr:uncharacterized protein LOC126853509 [Cataglyphis hispanica]